MSTDNAASKHYDFNSRMAPVGDKNIWVEYTGLARDYNAVNLGQVYIISINEIFGSVTGNTGSSAITYFFKIR